MARYYIVTTLLLLSITAVARTQHFDLLQGFQQLFQSYQTSKATRNQHDVTQHTAERQHNKHKSDDRRSNEGRKKIPTINEFDYVFATTTKPSRKTTKDSSQTIVVSNKTRNLNPGFILSNRENTAKSIRNKPKTTISNNIKPYTTTTTEKIHNFNLNNRAVSFKIKNDTVDNKKNEKSVAGITYDTNNYNNKKSVADNNLSNTAKTNNNRNNHDYSSTNSNANNNQNSYNKKIPDSDSSNYNQDTTNNRPGNNRNVNVANLNDKKTTNTLTTKSTDNNRGMNIHNNNQDISNNRPGNNRNVNVANLNDKKTTNTLTTKSTNNNRGMNIHSNNQDITNNRPGNNRNVNVANLNDMRITDTLTTKSTNNNRGTNINNNNQDITNHRPGNNRNVNVANLNDRRSSDTFISRSDTNREIYNNDNIPNNQESISRRNTETRAGNTNRGRNEHTNVARQVHSFGFVTENPLLNRPGVRPGVIQNSPPITNSPNNNNDYIFFSNSDGFTAPQEPELLIGPNEDDMTNLQRQRYVDLAEKMCDRYKALNVKKLVALPPSLVPSPDPVEFNVTSCNPVYIPLVIGGKVVDIKDYPHMSLIGWRKIGIAGYSWKCGGSLISDQYVLTAAHCTYQDKDTSVVSGLPHVVQLGSSYLDDPGAQVVKITSVIRHPKYKRKRAYHDIALVKMTKRVSFSAVIKPACIGVAPPVGNNIVATGWGRTELGGDHSHELRSVSLPIWSIPECRSVWETSRKLPEGPTPESHICAGDRTGQKDTCQGDSGGPAQIQDGCVWRVVAVTSIGKSCGAALTPALYAVIPRAFVSAQVFGEEVDYGGRGNTNSNRRGEEFYGTR